MAIALARPFALHAEASGKEDPNAECMTCHEDRSLKHQGKGGRTVSLFVDAKALARSVHATNACVSCHTDAAEVPHTDGFVAKPASCVSCHATQTRNYDASAHQLARQAGKANAPDCAGCHGTHDIGKVNAPGSRLRYTRQIETCGACHPAVAAEVKGSIHGRALAAGAREAPGCTDCHAEHVARLATAAPNKIAGDVCSRCHASERMNTKFSLPADRVKTFYESYHGLASKLGSTRAANCASCHGVHNILPSSDPRSSIHPSNLQNTCGKCHPGASARFAEGKIHVLNGASDGFGGTVNRWVRRVYLALIFGVIGLMLLHNALAWWRKAARSFHASDRVVLRMDLAQRIQHFLLATSFVYLAITGFALKYPDSWIAWLGGPNEELRKTGHRIAGVFLLSLGAVHLGYLAVTQEGRRLFRDLLPARSDLRDLATVALRLLGRDAARPRFGRFGYPEKFEYWAVLWGTGIMGVTGFAIWFKIDVTRFLPRWVVDVATTIHFYEAVLAVLAILVWHLYHVMFDPDTYPMNWAWMDGRVSEAWHREEHPEDTLARRVPPPGSAKSDGSSTKSAQAKKAFSDDTPGLSP
ncbi:MAG: cytochrome b/b6 domain-containing protein [Verrucomicrobiae bacterium]|nr:cytochrome b/b6 domain-containing protein [Verrucomicrobiae bacterium]